MCRDSEDLLRFLVRHTLSSATFGVSVAVNLVVSILLVFLSVVIDVTCGATLVVVVVRGVVTLTGTVIFSFLRFLNITTF